MKNNTRPLSNAQILKLFNLNLDQVKKLDINYKANELHVAITLSVKEHTCPVCGNTTTKIKGYTQKKILHAAITYLPCFIIYRARRYECLVCKKTFNEHNPFAYRNMKLSALTVSNVMADLKNSQETFTTVAKRYNLSSTTIAALFDSHVQVPRRQLPEHLLVDEVYAFKSSTSDYVCVFVDALTSSIIDLLPSRKQQHLLSYFNQIPLEERERVKTVGIDMWATYRNVTSRVFPNAVCSVDKFHVFQDFSKRLTTIRVDVMNGIKPPKSWKNSDDSALKYKYYKQDQLYYLLKKFNWLLMKNSNAMITINDTRFKLLDPNIPKKFNSKLNKYCNYNDLINEILELSPLINEAYSLKLKLELFYANATTDDAKIRLDNLIEQMHSSTMKSFNDFANTLRQWKQEIINSFIYVEKRTQIVNKKTGVVNYEVQPIRINNALIENKNRTIKKIKNNASGYGNWERFRNRVLYVLNPDATYLINPIDIT